ncbi:MAG: glycoside hydrolase family 13 protein [Bifidobacteriaceae bacterium]|nr:glycoside hydrolase family 13 protein [Bifidobacteriaceae bacterium]
MTYNNSFDDWWKQAVVYQIYPRSFKDNNGDGLGDFKGITEKVPYLHDLGVDALWLSPFYPSELADGGYDVIDYRDVDPRLGTMDDFDELVAAAHEAGMKIIVDIVPNHTSNKHAMFEAALKAGRGSAERDCYIFREGRGKHGELPPNDWEAIFGGSAWEQVEDGQWYLHLFTKEQPDLNWDNPKVHEEFITTLRFWADHGTDGFRIDVAHGLAKDLNSMPLEEIAEKFPIQSIGLADGTHPIWDRNEVHEIYKEWRKVFNEYNPPRFAVAEAWVVPEHQHLYASTDELGQVFNFDFAKAAWSAKSFREAITNGLSSAKETGDSTTTWVMSNHDIPRHATRFALPQVQSTQNDALVLDWILRDGKTYVEDRQLGTKRARAAIMMEAGLPGSIYIYQGEELGLFEVANIPWDQLEDPTAFFTRKNLIQKGRDGCRVPLPWVAADAQGEDDFITSGSFGFTKQNSSKTSKPHLPQPTWYKEFAVDVEEKQDDSMLNLYKQVLLKRAEVLTATKNTDCELLKLRDDVIAYKRVCLDKSKYFISVTNFGTESYPLPSGTIIMSSTSFSGNLLPQDTTAWMLIDKTEEIE